MEAGFARRFYLPSEVAEHRGVSDCWVSLLGRVYDLTPLIAEHRGSPLVEPLCTAAGSDISHWFEKSTGDLRKWVDPQLNCECYYTPMGRFVHVPPAQPDPMYVPPETPWWMDDRFVVGALTANVRHVRVVNTLTGDSHSLEVAGEEPIADIVRRYLPINAHAASYTWKYLGKPLDMAQSLAANGVVDEKPDLDALDLPDNTFYPALFLYFNDDLTVA